MRGFTFRTAVFLTPIAALLAFACGSEDGGTDENGAVSPPPGGSTPGAPPAAPPPPPVVRRGFPLAPPSLGGFTLAPAFPGAHVNSVIALVWPNAGAAPFALDRSGRIVEIAGGAAREVLDMTASVAAVTENGALGMALHPAFGDGSGDKPYVYLWYNTWGDPKNKQRLSRFTWNAASRTFDRSSESVLLEEEEEHAEHNAGHIQFGPDGLLYFGNGDDINDDNHQRIDRALFAGIFRIDVDMRGGAVSHPPPRAPAGGYSAGYFIPNDNPFVGVPGALEEFFLVGLRNPFGFSFDRATGALWVGDVGDTWREEINIGVSGGNYGWPYSEGELIRGTHVPTIGTLRAPKFAFSHAEMGDLTSILGGYVYRGTQFPELVGSYIYSDWPSGRIWALDSRSAAPTRVTLVDNEWRLLPMALAQDPEGEIYILHLNGIAKLARSASREAVPKRLSETLLFSDVAALEPEPELVPYAINAPLWSDEAVKRRWIALPKGEHVALGEGGALSFPVGTIFVKHFELAQAVSPHARTRRLETRVVVVGKETSYGLSYRWNAQGTDADLVAEPADEPIQDDAAQQTRAWHFPSFGQCWSCHKSENRVLGFTARQLNLTGADGVSQLEALAARGVFDPAAIAAMPPGLSPPSDTNAALEARATAWLAANCSSCHHEGAYYLGGEQTWHAEPGVALADRGLIGAPHHNNPMARAFNLFFASLIEPGNPDGSILMARVKSNNPDLRMPPLGRNRIDEDGVRLIEQWIRSLPAR